MYTQPYYLTEEGGREEANEQEKEGGGREGRSKGTREQGKER